MKATQVAIRIKELRILKGYTQQQMAEELKITQEAYSKIETGVSTVTLTRLEVIAGKLGISLARLFDDTIPIDKLNVSVPHRYIEQCYIGLLGYVYKEEMKKATEKNEEISTEELNKRIVTKTSQLAMQAAEFLYSLTKN